MIASRGKKSMAALPHAGWDDGFWPGSTIGDRASGFGSATHAARRRMAMACRGLSFVPLQTVGKE